MSATKKEMSKMDEETKLKMLYGGIAAGAALLAFILCYFIFKGTASSVAPALATAPATDGSGGDGGNQYGSYGDGSDGLGSSGGGGYAPMLPLTPVVTPPKIKMPHVNIQATSKILPNATNLKSGLITADMPPAPTVMSKLSSGGGSDSNSTTETEEGGGTGTTTTKRVLVKRMPVFSTRQSNDCGACGNQYLK